MKEGGLLKGGTREEENWRKSQAFLREPFKIALDRFREEVLEREDFDPTSLLQFGLFMSMGVLNVLKEVEKKFGEEGQNVVKEALIKTGYDVGKQMVDINKIPSNMPDIEIMSFLATIINTQMWTSIEDPKIDNKDRCSFNILWCPLQDIYKAFDCRVQRYFVQGIVNYFKDNVFESEKSNLQIKFESIIPAGADVCRFTIQRKETGVCNEWEAYSRDLERRALKKLDEERQHDPRDIEKVLAPLLNGADVVMSMMV